jgi:hypothetical protein
MLEAEALDRIAQLERVVSRYQNYLDSIAKLPLTCRHCGKSYYEHPAPMGS